MHTILYKHVFKSILSKDGTYYTNKYIDIK